MKIATTLSALALTASALLLAPGPSAGAAGETCLGQSATHVGGSSGTVRGTDGADVIATAGARVQALAGDDVVCVVAGEKVTVKAGTGADTVDTTALGAGATISTTFTDGHDTYTGGPAGDTVFTDNATGATDTVDTGAGDDSFTAYGVTERNDPVEMSVQVRMGEGDDILDVYYPAPGSLLDGGAGDDHLKIGGNLFDDLSVDLTSGTILTDGRTGTRAPGIEDVIARATTVVVTGTDGPDDLQADGCDITIKGRGGDDWISHYYDADEDYDFDCAKTTRFRGGAGNDHLRTHWNSQDVRGGRGADYLTGSYAADRFRGGRGHDEMRGSGGNDVLIGGAGRDRAVGGRGQDTCRAESRTRCERR